MPTDLTAAALADIVQPLKREDWPDDLSYRVGDNITPPHWDDSCGDWLLVDHAAAIFKSHLTEELVGQGYHRFEWGHNSDTDMVSLDLYGDHHVESKTILGCLVAAVVSTYARKENPQ